MGGALIPVVDHEKSWTERGNEQDAASRAHRAFQDPHSLHRGSAPENDVARDTGVGVVRKGTSKLVKNEKGQWVKPRHDRPVVVAAAAAPIAETAGKRDQDRDRPERFVPAKAWVGERAGYYFARGREGVGYYADDAQGDARPAAPAGARGRRRPARRARGPPRAAAGSVGTLLVPPRCVPVAGPDASCDPKSCGISEPHHRRQRGE